MSLSISGTFDSNTIGDLPGYLAIKNDWSNNIGVHTELFASAPSITSNTITFDGASPMRTEVQDGHLISGLLQNIDQDHRKFQRIISGF